MNYLCVLNESKMSANSKIKEDKIREQVIRTGQALFQKYGMQAITMEDFAEAIGKAKSSLYYYYKSKEEIWDAVMDIEIGEIVTAVEQAVAKANTIEQKVHAFCGTILKGLRKKRALYSIAHGENKKFKRDRSTSSIRRNFVKQESELFNHILSEGIKKGELRPMKKKEQDILVFVLLSGLKGLEKEMVLEKDYDLEPAVKILSNMIIHGLKTKE